MRRALTLLLLVSATIAAAKSDWPQFRGPAGNGIAEGIAAPTRWSAEENVAWRVDVPGEGWSAPIVVGDRVLVTTAVPAGGGKLSFELHAYALDSGDLVWTAVPFEGPSSIPKHRDNSFASETPVSDGEHVYAYWGMNGVACYTLDGALVWKKDLGSYPIDNDWGTSSSPVLVDGRLFLQIDNVDDSFVVALDASTGEELWRVERPGEVSNWSSPLVWENSLRTEIVLGGKTFRSYDPATGKELWNLPIGGRSSATGAAVGDLLYVGSENRSQRGGTPGGLAALRAGSSGTIDVTDPAASDNGLVWFNESGAVGIASPLVYGGQIYVPERRGGVIRVHDALTGEVTFRKRLPGGGVFWTSPWTVVGEVFLMDERGKTFALAPGAEYALQGESQLEGRFWSTPAVTDGAVVVRSFDTLFCVRAD